ncbi:uncharacterized protein si:ch211-139g16.8 isoform X1 [Scomber scombrus]|uniref:uncharacterized protein si:ch211-139g16.8 isoform X1 n=1 Tax=Scomber scombrus TaxID=13677 RepID=UPI002DD8E335|nr:uncharacterized protein si:ch211-139g16.8 isoform X1 [Scomber scombrus]
MRSFTSCQAVDMDRLFGFSLLLAYLSVIESTGKKDSCLSQPGEVLWKKIGDAADLSCNVSSDCSGLRYQWFVFKEEGHLRLDVESNHPKYSLNGASLHINSLIINDSGIYHCAAVSKGKTAPGAQHIGTGTLLEVKEVLKTTLRNILLWISFALLSVYSLAIVTLIILKKYGCTICSGKRMHTPDKVVDKCLIFFGNLLMFLHVDCTNQGKALKSKKRNRNQGRSKLLARKGSCHTKCDRAVLS